MSNDGILKLFGASLIAVSLLVLAVREKRSHFHLKIEIEWNERTGLD
jgi:hypothetical protein